MDTQRQRLERAFETLKKQNITPILKLKGSTGVIEWDLQDYTFASLAAGTPDSWVGAHAGDEQTGGTFWDDRGRLRHRHDDKPVQQLWFSFPLNRPEIAALLAAALEDWAFYTTWTDPDGNPGTVADRVRLVLKEED
jgi:hypothetical protein